MSVRAATLLAPRQLEVRSYPYPEELEPGAVLLRMLASGICGTDKHTFRGETEQYAGTEHARSTPFPIIQGHENVGVVAAIGTGARRASTARRWRSATASSRRPTAPAARANVRARLPVLPLPQLENYGNSLSSRDAPHLFGGWSEYLYLKPAHGGVPRARGAADEVAVLTEIFAVTHSLERARALPSPAASGRGSVAVIGVGALGLAHASRRR